MQLRTFPSYRETSLELGILLKKQPNSKRGGIRRKGCFKYFALIVSSNTRLGSMYCDIKWLKKGPREMDVIGSIAKRIHVSHLKKLIISNRRESQSEIEIQQAREETFDPILETDIPEEEEEEEGQLPQTQANPSNQFETPLEEIEKDSEYNLVASNILRVMGNLLETTNASQHPSLEIIAKALKDAATLNSTVPLISNNRPNESN
jgi:hypothetical protein